MTKTLVLLSYLLLATGVMAQDTVNMTVCKHFWKTGEAMNGDIISLEEYDPSDPFGSALLFVLDSNTNCMDIPFYNLSGFPPDLTRCFNAYKGDDYLNGITVLDLLAISKHILGLEPLPSIYAMIAADVNISGSITTFDIVQLRAILLGTQDPQTPAWRFFPETCDFPNPNNPFQGSSCPCIVNSEMSAWDGEMLDIIGVKSGDVDGDAEPNGQFLGPPTTDSIVLILPDDMLAPGIHTLPVSFESNLDLGGLQIEARIDTGKAHLLHIEGAALALTLSSWSTFSDGRFRVVGWPSSAPVVTGSTLFNLTLNVEEPVALSDLIQVIQTGLRPLGVAADQKTPLSVKNKFEGFVSVQNPLEDEIIVSPASPNPFFDKTYINIRLERTEYVYLEISDLAGKRLHYSEHLMGAGEHRIEIPHSAIPSGSMGMYKVQAGQHSKTGKIMRL